MFLRQSVRSTFSRISGGARRRLCSSGVNEEGKRDYLGIAFFSSICISTAVLGTWQVKRFFWKLDLIETIKNSAADPPALLPISNSQDELRDRFREMKGQRVLLSGKFDHSKEIFLGLRSAPPGFTGGPAQGMASNPQGYYVITPMILQDGTVVHVNRGWIPRQLYPFSQTTSISSATMNNNNNDNKNDIDNGSGGGSVGWSRPEGVVSVEAVVSEGEKAGTFSPVVHPGLHTLLWLDSTALQQRTGMKGTGQDSAHGSAIIAEAIEHTTDTNKSNNSGNTSGSKEEEKEKVVLPYAKNVSQLQEQTVPPATHFVYALTWFSLATAGFFMTYLKFRRGGIGGVASAAKVVGKAARKGKYTGL